MNENAKAFRGERAVGQNEKRVYEVAEVKIISAHSDVITTSGDELKDNTINMWEEI